MERQYFYFKGIRFPYNPKSIVVKRERRLARFFSPLSGNILQDLGQMPTVISGVGELGGSLASEQLAAITELFESEGKGLLQLPGHPVIMARFASLQSEEDAGLPLIRYRFSFIEETA